MTYAGNIEESMPLADYYAMLSRYEGDSFVLDEANRKLYERESDFIEKYVEKDAKILDIGCAFGGLLTELKRRGFTELFGVEPSPKNCHYAKTQFGINAYVGGMGGIPPEIGRQKFDLVILSDVFEHLFDLRGAAEECRVLLSTAGYLCIVVPDMEQFQYLDDLYQEFSMEHINYFDRASLKTLFSSFGLTLVDERRDQTPMAGVAGHLHSLWRMSDDARGMTIYQRETDAMGIYLRHCAALEKRVKARAAAFDLTRGLYIWGSSTLTAILFQLGIVKSGDVLGIVDSNRNYQGKTAYGHEIAAPESLRDHPDVPILISSQYAQEAIARTISEQMKLPNPVLRLFDAAQSTS
jgi:methyltransferase type 12